MSLLCATLGSHERTDCVELTGGVNALAILLSGWEAVITDPSNATQWNTAISQGLARVIKDIKGDVPASASVETANPSACGNENVYVGADWLLNMKDFNVGATNDEFYVELKRQRTFDLAYVTCDGELFIITGVNYSGSFQIHTENNREFRRYEGMFKSYQKLTSAGPIEYELPTGIFSF
jgi:hypothetical protein